MLQYFICLFDFGTLLVILPNLTHFGHDGSSYFKDYSRTKHCMMIKYTVPESLICE